MSKLILTVGLPASGKSTWAKEYLSKNPTTKRVNREELRLMVDNGKWSQEREKRIKQAEKVLASNFIQSGFDVIVDDTNLSEKTRNSWRQFASEYGADFVIQDFRDVPVDLCIKRDNERSRPVGKDVILRMYYDFLLPSPIVQNPVNTSVVIVDLDGTLALFGKDKSPYDRDFINDLPNSALIKILEMFRNHSNTLITILSGRKDSFRDETIQWLKKYEIPYDFLFMRKENDARADTVIKMEFFKEFISDRFNVIAVFDDRPTVIRNVWHKLGLPVFKYGVEYDH